MIIIFTILWYKILKIEDWYFVYDLNKCREYHNISLLYNNNNNIDFIETPYHKWNMFK